MLTLDQKSEIERRLNNWARWWYGGSGHCDEGDSPYPAYNLTPPGDGYDPGLARIPLMSGEAATTDAALRKLEGVHKRILLAHYLQNGGAWQKSKRFKVSLPTFYRMVERASVNFWTLCYPRRPITNSEPFDKQA